MAVSVKKSSSDEEFLNRNIRGVFGMPYQFMPTVDRRLEPLKGEKKDNERSRFGRKYAEKIVSRLPLLLLAPGSASFLHGFSGEDKNRVLNSLGNGGNLGDISSVLDGNGKYYTFQYAYSDYYQYVNSACQTVAILLGVGNEEVTIGTYRKKLKEFDWGHSGIRAGYGSYFSVKESIPFYIDSETSITETFSNDTTESALAGQMNDLGAQVREFKYVLGAATGGNSAVQMLGTTFSQALQAAGLNGGLVPNLAAGIGTLLYGGKLVFPKMWADSDFTREYSINFKFRSPDHDNLSIYLNIIVPYLHLVCMTAPKMLSSTNVNAIDSPFLVRGFYKGFFNCDMGMITSLAATKGAECQWNDDGLPTQMDVSMNLQDLYTNMSISSAYKKHGPTRFVKNTNLIDFLAMTAGLNLDEPELTRSAKIAWELTKNKWTSFPYRKFNDLSQSITNRIGNLYTRFGGF